MSGAEAFKEWDLVVPEDDAAFVAELRRHGVRPGLRLHVSIVPEEAVARANLPSFARSFRSGSPDLAERSKEILRSEFPGE